MFLTGSQVIPKLLVRDNVWRSESLERCNFSLSLFNRKPQSQKNNQTDHMDHSLV